MPARGSRSKFADLPAETEQIGLRVYIIASLNPGSEYIFCCCRKYRQGVRTTPHRFDSLPGRFTSTGTGGYRIGDTA